MAINQGADRWICIQVAQEALAALRTVQVFNAAPYEEKKFSERVERVLTLARREAIASGIFFGTTGWSGNVTLLALLGYGSWTLGSLLRERLSYRALRRIPREPRADICRRTHKLVDVYGLCR